MTDRKEPRKSRPLTEEELLQRRKAARKSPWHGMGKMVPRKRGDG